MSKIWSLPEIEGLASGDIDAWGLSDRDARILRMTRATLAGRRGFDTALAALRASVERVIPAGQVFYLGAVDGRAVVGSLVSGVGIVDGRVVGVVRVRRDGTVERLGALSR